jgi:hypothetical protein
MSVPNLHLQLIYQLTASPLTGGRLICRSKDMLELAGLTTRLYALISTLHNLPPPQGEISTNNENVLDNVNVCVPSQSQNGTEDNVFSGSAFHGSHPHPMSACLLSHRMVLKTMYSQAQRSTVRIRIHHW